MPNVELLTHWEHFPQCALPDAIAGRIEVAPRFTTGACEHGYPLPHRLTVDIERDLDDRIEVASFTNDRPRARFALPFVMSIASAQSVRYFDRIERAHRAALIEARRNRRRHHIEHAELYGAPSFDIRACSMSEGRALLPYIEPTPFTPRTYWEIERAADVMLRDDAQHGADIEHTFARTDVLDRMTRRMFVQPDRAAFRGAAARSTGRGDVRTLDVARGAMWGPESPGYHAWLLGLPTDRPHSISVRRRRTAVTYRGAAKHTRTTLAKGPAHRSRGVGIAYRPTTAEHGYAGSIPLLRFIGGAPCIIERGFRSVEAFTTLATHPARRFVGMRGTFPYVPRSERSAVGKSATAKARTSSTGARGKNVTVWSASDRSMARIWSRAVNLTRTTRDGIEVPNIGADPERIEAAERLLAVMTSSTRGAVIEVTRHGNTRHITTADGVMWSWVEQHAVTPRLFGARDMARRAVLDGVALTD